MRLTSRWPLILAAIFCTYSVLLLWNAFQSREELQAAVDARLIADSKRRASALGDFAADQRNTTRELAEVHELRTYLINKALGMSPRYGLDASLDAVEQRFREQIEKKKLGADPILHRILFLDQDGKALVDTAPEQDGPPLPPGPASDASLSLEAARGWLIATAPVMFKDELSGTLVTVGALAHLYRFLIHLENEGTYRETLLTCDGQEVPGPDGKPIFATPFAARLINLPEDQPVPLSRLPRSDGDMALRDSIAIKTSVAGMPMALVTTMSSDEIYGRVNSPLFLYSLGLFPVLVLFAALRLRVDRLQVRTAMLARQAAHSDNHRQELQGQNAALSEEIRRREAVERELQHHQNHLEESVAQRTAELNSLFLALPDLYFRLGRDGTVLDYRSGSASDPHVAPEVFLGKRIQDVFPAEVSRNVMAALEDIAAGKDQCVYEYGLPMPSGQQFYEARVLPLNDEQRVIVVRNITERRALEHAREANRLETERLARVKSEFLANMSHEIRTPLNGILGMAQIGYRESEGRTKSREAFSKILESGNLLLGIISDILDLSKIEAGKLRLESVPIELHRVVEHAREIVAERARAKGIALSVRMAADLPETCLSDPLRLEQILLNLLSNAVKFTERGSVILGAARDDTTLVFEITDTGIGMSEAQLAQLFTPFEQADGSTTRRFGGTGLGLAIVKRLVELMGGLIRVDSQEGQGTRFEVRLPFLAALAKAPGVNAPVSSLILEPATGPRLADLTLLVSEDTEINQLVLQEFLANEGARVVMVDDGQQAVERVIRDGAAAFDLVLMDIQMPVMDGYEATRRIHQVNPDLPVVGQTAHALAEERSRCFAAGMIDHVAKPIELENLVAVVLRHTRGSVRTVAPASSSAAPPMPPGLSVHIDWPGLQAQFGGRQGFSERLAVTLLNSQRGTPDRLREAIGAHNLEALVFIIHALKGVVGNLGLPQFYDLTVQAEKAARQQQAQALAMAQALIAPLERILAETDAYLAGRKP